MAALSVEEKLARCEDARARDLLIVTQQRAASDVELARLSEQNRVLREFVVVVARMLQRADGFKPQTDDEKAVLRAVSFEASLPAGNRRIAHPQTSDYVEATAQLFFPLFAPEGEQS